MKFGVHLPSSPKRPSHRHLRITCITVKIGRPHIKQIRAFAALIRISPSPERSQTAARLSAYLIPGPRAGMPALPRQSCGSVAA